jgi:hypothetical protein
MDDWTFPPWSPAADERVATDRSAFHNCEAAVRDIASRGDGEISHETYTLSEEWGKVLRAKVTFTFEGSPTTSLVTCWSVSGPRVKMWVKKDDGERDEDG